MAKENKYFQTLFDSTATGKNYFDALIFQDRGPETPPAEDALILQDRPYEERDDIYLPPRLRREDKGTFRNAFEAGVAGMRANQKFQQALRQDALGNRRRATTFIEQGRQAQQDASEALALEGTFSDFLNEPTVGGFLQQAVLAIGQFTPSAVASISQAIAGGGVFALGRIGLGKLARDLGMRKAAKDIAAKKMRGEALDKTEKNFLQDWYDVMRGKFTRADGSVIYNPGFILGAGAQEYTQGGGILYGDFAAQGMRDAEARRRARGGGLGYAFIGVAGEAAVFTSFSRLSKYSKPSKTLKRQLAKDILFRGGLQSSISEGLAERAQEEISVQQKFRIDPDYTKAEAKLDRLQALFAGVVGGFGMGSVGGSLASINRIARRKFVETAQNTPDLFKGITEEEKEVNKAKALANTQEDFVMAVVDKDGNLVTGLPHDGTPEGMEQAEAEIRRQIPDIGQPDSAYSFYQDRAEAKNADGSLKPLSTLDYVNAFKKQQGITDADIDDFLDEIMEETTTTPKLPIDELGNHIGLEIIPRSLSFETKLVTRMTKSAREGFATEKIDSYSPTLNPNIKKDRAGFNKNMQEKVVLFSEQDFDQLTALLEQRIQEANSWLLEAESPSETAAEFMERSIEAAKKGEKVLKLLTEEDIGKPKEEVLSRLNEDVGLGLEEDFATQAKESDLDRSRPITEEDLAAINAAVTTDTRPYGIKDPRRFFGNEVLGKPLYSLFSDSLMQRLEELREAEPGSIFTVFLETDQDQPLYGKFKINRTATIDEINFTTTAAKIKAGLDEAIRSEKKKRKGGREAIPGYDRKGGSGWFVVPRKGEDGTYLPTVKETHIKEAKKNGRIPIEMTQLTVRGSQINHLTGKTLLDPENDSVKWWRQTMADGFFTAILELDKLGYDIEASIHKYEYEEEGQKRIVGTRYAKVTDPLFYRHTSELGNQFEKLVVYESAAKGTQQWKIEEELAEFEALKPDFSATWEQEQGKLQDRKLIGQKLLDAGGVVEDVFGKVPIKVIKVKDIIKSYEPDFSTMEKLKFIRWRQAALRAHISKTSTLQNAKVLFRPDELVETLPALKTQTKSELIEKGEELGIDPDLITLRLKKEEIAKQVQAAQKLEAEKLKEKKQYAVKKEYTSELIDRDNFNKPKLMAQLKERIEKRREEEFAREEFKEAKNLRRDYLKIGELGGETEFISRTGEQTVSGGTALETEATGRVQVKDLEKATKRLTKEGEKLTPKMLESYADLILGEQAIDVTKPLELSPEAERLAAEERIENDQRGEDARNDKIRDLFGMGFSSDERVNMIIQDHRALKKGIEKAKKDAAFKARKEAFKKDTREAIIRERNEKRHAEELKKINVKPPKGIEIFSTLGDPEGYERFGTEGRWDKKYPGVKEILAEITKNPLVKKTAGRSVVWFGPIEYAYTGARHSPQPMPEMYSKMARELEIILGYPEGYFNAVLANAFPKGKKIGAHSDDESIFVRENRTVGAIATLTLGGEAKVTITNKKTKEKEEEFIVKNGEVYVMPDGRFQFEKNHQVGPAAAPRVSITFRHIPKTRLPEAAPKPTAPGTFNIQTAVLHSGGATGADSQFEMIGKRYGLQTQNVKHYYMEGSKPPRGNTLLTEEQKKEAKPFVDRAAKALGRFAPTNPKVVPLIHRNWFQVKNSDALFAISNLDANKPGTVKGGTGWAVQMAIDANKPVFVFDQGKKQWFTWEGKKFVETETPTLTPSFAGVGTRSNKLTDAGRQAIEDLYKKSVGQEVKAPAPVPPQTGPKQIFIPFSETARSQIISGTKTQTARSAKLGNEGDIFIIEGKTFVLTKTPYQKTMGDIINQDFVAEGFNSPAELEQAFKNLRFNTSNKARTLWAHEFAPVGETPTPVGETPTPAAPEPTASINVYYGRGENKELSNFAIRPFDYEGRPYRSVEHAYQTNKNGVFDNATYVNEKWQKADPRKAVSPALRNQTKSEEVMKKAMKASFEQNPEALKLLLDTGNQRITHIPETGHWREAFPRLLMEVRDELSSAQEPTPGVDMPPTPPMPTYDDIPPYDAVVENEVDTFVKEQEDIKKQELVPNTFFSPAVQKYFNKTPFTGLRSIKGPSVPVKMARLARSAFKIDRNIEIIVINHTEALNKNPKLNPAQIAYIEKVRKRWKEKATLGGNVITMGNTRIIMLRLSAKPIPTDYIKNVFVFGHELGHILFKQEWAKMSIEQQTRMFKAWEKAKKQPNAPKQWSAENGLEEWAADRSSRFLYDETMRAEDASDTFFKKFASLLRKAFNQMHDAFKTRFGQEESVGYDLFEEWAGGVVQAYREGSRDFKDRGEITASQEIEIQNMIDDTVNNMPESDRKAYSKLMASFLRQLKRGKKDLPTLLSFLVKDSDNAIRGVGKDKESRKAFKKLDPAAHGVFGWAGNLLTKMAYGKSQSMDRVGYSNIMQRKKRVYSKDLVGKLVGYETITRVKAILEAEGSNPSYVMEDIPTNPSLDYMRQHTETLFIIDKERAANLNLDIGSEKRIAERLKKLPIAASQNTWIINEYTDGAWGGGNIMVVPSAKWRNKPGFMNAWLKAVQRKEKPYKTALSLPRAITTRLNNRFKIAKQIPTRDTKKRKAVLNRIENAELIRVLEERDNMTYNDVFVPNIGIGEGQLSEAAFGVRYVYRYFYGAEKLSKFGVRLTNDFMARMLDVVELQEKSVLREKLVNLILKHNKGITHYRSIQSPHPGVTNKELYEAYKAKKKSITVTYKDGSKQKIRLQPDLGIVTGYYEQAVWSERQGKITNMTYWEKFQVNQELAEKIVQDIVAQPDLAVLDVSMSEDEYLSNDSLVNPADAQDFAVGLLPHRSKIFAFIPTAEMRKAGVLQDPDITVDRYMSQTIKKMEWEKRGGWKRASALINTISDPFEQKMVRTALKNTLGKYEVDMSSAFRAINSWGLFMNISTLLAFAVFASFPDLAGPILRSKEWRALKVAGQSLYEMYQNPQEAARIAEEVGVATREALDNMYIHSVDADWMLDTPRAWSDKFFKYTFTEGYTRFMRQFAGSMGKQFLIYHAEQAKKGNKRSIRYLAELDGLKWDTVENWQASGYSFLGEDGRTVRDALGRFVEESVIRPNAAERPYWASDPRFALIWQLKAFFYAYGKVVVGGVAREALSRKKETGNVSAMLPPLMLFATTVLPLTMLGWDMREKAKYGLATALPFVDPSPSRLNDMDWGPYLFEVMDRSGVMGPYTILTQMRQNYLWGESPVTPILGPTVEKFEDIITKGSSYNYTNLVPLYSQLPKRRY